MFILCGSVHYLHPGISQCTSSFWVNVITHHIAIIRCAVSFVRGERGSTEDIHWGSRGEKHRGDGRTGKGWMKTGK
jgi:hypothetical protein